MDSISIKIYIWEWVFWGNIFYIRRFVKAKGKYVFSENASIDSNGENNLNDCISDDYIYNEQKMGNCKASFVM